MAAFQPIGDRARWRIVYDLLRKADVGDVTTYETLGEALELDPTEDRHAIQMAVRRAAVEHEEVDHRALESVPNVGYRIVEAQEHLRLARTQQRRSSKALARGQSKVVNVDMNGLPPEVRKAFDVTARAFAMLLDYNRRLDTRQRRLEDAIGSVVERSERSESEIATLRERLARLEGQRLSG
jgi:hypothetical protein